MCAFKYLAFKDKYLGEKVIKIDALNLVGWEFTSSINTIIHVKPISLHAPNHTFPGQT